MGKPGSGKMTQANLLAQRMGFEIFSTGTQLRLLCQEETPFGLRVKTEMNEGKLLPSWIVEYLFHRKILSLHEKNGIVYEGAGRRLDEAEVIHDTMLWLARPYRVVFLDISDEESLDRRAKRQKTENRADDNEKAARVRLDWYYSDTAHSVEFFRGKGMLVAVNGEQDEAAVFAEMMEKLEASGKVAEREDAQ